MNNSIKTKLRLSTAAGILFAASLLAPASADTLPDSSNLELWLNADTGVTTTSGGAVTEWADQSGKGNNATQTTVGDQPTLVSDAINGNAAISFNGTSSYLSILNTLNVTSGMSIFIVAENAVDKNYNGLFVLNNSQGSPYGGGGDYFSAFYQQGSTTTGSGNLYTFANRNGSPEGFTYENDVPPAQGTPYVYNYNANATSETMLIDNADVGAAHGESGYLPSAAGYGTIGDFGEIGSGGVLDGDIAEILVYNTELSTADQTAVYNYLDAKYLEAAVPEPATWILLMVSATVGVIVHRWRKSARD